MTPDLIDNRPQAANLRELRKLAEGCRACPLWRYATQAVCGEGPARARLMLVGEQPGDQEDLTGRPFVGPAGGVLDRALKDAKLPREKTYITNALKHFKHVARGKRRLHQRPNQSEIDACQWWLAEELRLVAPKLVIALGATAARSLLGRSVTISRVRGTPMEAMGVEAFVTVHPSYILRVPDEPARKQVYEELVGDLVTARTRLAALE